MCRVSVRIARRRWVDRPGDLDTEIAQASTQGALVITDVDNY